MSLQTHRRLEIAVQSLEVFTLRNTTSRRCTPLVRPFAAAVEEVGSACEQTEDEGKLEYRGQLEARPLALRHWEDFAAAQ